MNTSAAQIARSISFKGNILCPSGNGDTHAGWMEGHAFADVRACVLLVSLLWTHLSGLIYGQVTPQVERKIA